MVKGDVIDIQHYFQISGVKEVGVKTEETKLTTVELVEARSWVGGSSLCYSFYFGSSVKVSKNKIVPSRDECDLPKVKKLTI